MESRSVGFSLAGLAGVGAIIAALSAGQSARSAQQPVATAASPTRGELVHMVLGSADSVRSTYRHGAALLEDYTRRRIGCTPSGGGRDCGRPAAVRDTLQVLIASVPDPVDSHLDWAYDAYLEALRRSMGAAGYVPDRYWLPTAADSLLVTIEGGAQRDTQRVTLHEFYPGVLLFRSADPTAHKLALLYLVSELPTTGEHKEAFLTAVRERKLLLGDSTLFVVPAHVRDTLLIAGPIFSGAASSLRLAIDDAIRYVDRGLRGVRIVTGSATNDRNQLTLSGTTDGVPVQFQATLNSDDAMQRVLDGMLPRLGLQPHQVATLHESSTQYASQKVKSEYLSITFPLNIASLRNEVGDSPLDAGAIGAIPGLSQAARTRLELRDKSRPRENPPVISVLTVPTLELILDEIVRVLDEHEIRAVIIQATDIRDQLLLAREIRQRNRDAQVIVFQGHRLLLRPEHSKQLNGTLVLTSYPLFLENQWWARGANDAVPAELLALSNDAALGTYNSVLTLLGLPERRIEFDSPISHVDDAPATPPIWLTAVANGAFVPVTVTATDSAFRSYFGTDGSPARDRHTPLRDIRGTHTTPRIAVAFLGLLLLACCVVVIATRNPIAPAPRRDSPRLEISYRRIETYSLLIHERIYATLLVIAVSGMFIPIAATMLLLSMDWFGRLFVWMVASTAMVSVAVGVTDVLRLLRRSGGEGFRYAFFSPDWRAGAQEDSASPKVTRFIFRRGRIAQLRWLGEITGRGIIALVGLLHFVLTILYAVQLRTLALDDPSRFLLLSYRALRAWSGMSPLLPLMICGAGFTLWSAWQWRVTHRLHQATTATEEVALAHARSVLGRTLHDPFSRAANCVEAARASLFRIHPTSSGFALTATLLILCLLITQQHVGSVERLVLANSGAPWSYDALFWVGTFSMLVTGAWALYRIASTWRALQSALGVLGETPLFNAFGRLPRHVSKLTRLSIFADGESAATLQSISERWRTFRRQVSALEQEIVGDEFTALRSTDRDAALALVSIMRRDRHTDRDFCSLDKRIRMRHVRRTACALRSAWRATDTLAAPTGTAPIEELPPLKSISAALRTAEDFLAIECVRYIESVLHDLRLLASFLLVTLLLSVLLLSSYPFQPQGIVKLAFIALLLSTVVVLFLVMTQMSRDDVLSSITRTDAGKVSWDTTMVLNVALFGAIPLLALLSSEFPGVRSFLFSWAEPMVRSLVKS